MENRSLKKKNAKKYDNCLEGFLYETKYLSLIRAGVSISWAALRIPTSTNKLFIFYLLSRVFFTP